MLTKSSAIVLHQIKFGDSSLIVEVLTDVWGRLSFMVRTSQNIKGKGEEAIFSASDGVGYRIRLPAKANLQHIKDVRIALPYLSIPIDPVKSSVMLFLSEFLFHVTKGEQENRSLFNYIVTSLQWLDGSVSNYANFHLVFMMRLSRFIGFYPNLNEYEPDCYFDLRNGCFVGVAPLHSDFLEPLDASRVNQLMRMDYETMQLFKLSHTDRNRFTELALRYYRLHVPNMPELQSFKILKEVFA